MLRLASPSAVRAIASPKIHFLSIGKIRFLSISNASREETPIVSHRHCFSTYSANLAHRKLVEALKSEIKSHKLALIRSRGAPEKLPFTIEDDPNYCHVMLTNESGEEKMEVTVNPVYEEEEEKEKSVYINVSLSKEAKGTLDLGAYVSADKILMHKISYTKPGTYGVDANYYVDADGDLQNGWREFVESRGIEKSKVGFLYDYMVVKRKRFLYDYMVEKRKSWGTVWNPCKKTEIDDLQNLKKFVEEW